MNARTAYLLLYNVSLCAAWALILVRYITTKNYDQEKVFLLLLIAQTAAILEVIHALIGLVRSPVMTTATQVYSRLMIVWTVMYIFPEVRRREGMPLCIAAWSITEIIRYAFYACSLVNSLPYFIKWARYTFFIFLYPIGVTGELLCIYFALPLTTDHVWWYFVISAILYIPVFPQLYMYMFGQRKKVLGGGSVARSEKKRD